MIPIWMLSLLFLIFTSCSFYLTFSISEPPDQSFPLLLHSTLWPLHKTGIQSNTFMLSRLFLGPSVSHWLSLCILFTVKTSLKELPTTNTFLSIKGYNLDIDLVRSVHFFICIYLFKLFWPHHTACGSLVPQPRIKPELPALEVHSLNLWTASKVPDLCIL